MSARFRLVAFCVLIVACACSGGGSGAPVAPVRSLATAGPPVTVTSAEPVATPMSTASAVAAFTAVSLPAGLGVTVSNGGATTTSPVTPARIKPIVSNFATTITIHPANGAADYSYTTDFHGAGVSEVFYNEHADTSGSLAGLTTTRTARAAASVRRAVASTAATVRVGVRSSAGRPAASLDRLIVRYRAADGGRAAERALGVARAYTIDAAEPNLRVVAVPPGTSLATFARSLRARPEVASVEPDMLYYLQSSSAVLPDDPHFDAYQQWDMFDIGAPNAWGYSEGSSAVQIAMIDTGIDASSPDFAGAKIAFAESIVDGTVTQGLGAVRDTDGHGTNTAGIAAAAANNGFGFAGTSFAAGLQIYKVFADDTAGNAYAATALESDVTAAIDAAVRNGAKVINLSLGTCQADGADSAQQAAIARALASGVVVVAAAGNERAGKSSVPGCSGGSSTVDFPAADAGVISVGATSLDDSAAPMVAASAIERVASYSNAGPGLSVVAPGGDPSAAESTATGPPDDLHWIDNDYSTTVADPTQRCADASDCHALFAGTSQAAPHVSGLVALMLARATLSPAEVKQIIIATADDIGDPSEGNGRIDAYRALAAVTDDPNPPAKPAAKNFVAFAYVPNGSTRPRIVDVTYPAGVPVAGDGTFRVADVPADTGTFKIGVWFDANGDGLVDAGDYFASSQACTPDAPCTSAAALSPAPVATGFVP